jgi:hypothetical protein
MDRAAIWIGSILAGLAALTVPLGAPPWLSLSMAVVGLVAVVIGFIGGGKDVQQWWARRREAQRGAVIGEGAPQALLTVNSGPATVPSRGALAVESRVGPTSPEDVTRQFLLLRDEGRALRARIEAVPWGERQQDLGFGQGDLDDWRERCRGKIWDYRPERQPAFEDAVGRLVTGGNWAVHTLDTAAIDLWQQRTAQIDLVLRVIDEIIGNPQASTMRWLRSDGM